jgi:hypothetical protein
MSGGLLAVWLVRGVRGVDSLRQTARVPALAVRTAVSDQDWNITATQTSATTGVMSSRSRHTGAQPSCLRQSQISKARAPAGVVAW